MKVVRDELPEAVLASWQPSEALLVKTIALAMAWLYVRSRNKTAKLHMRVLGQSAGEDAKTDLKLVDY